MFKTDRLLNSWKSLTKHLEIEIVELLIHLLKAMAASVAADLLYFVFSLFPFIELAHFKIEKLIRN